LLGELPPRHRRQRGDVVVTVVERRDVAEAAAARLFEDLAVLHVDLVQSLEAVDGEPGANHVDALQLLLPHAFSVSSV